MSRPTQFGRFSAPEPTSALLRFHHHCGGELREVDHEPRIAVLDQEDLLAQGIRCSEFIPGAGDPDALGSCTANTTIECLSNILTTDRFAEALSTLGAQTTHADGVYENTVAAERAAIGFYHRCTDQTASSSTEWPPTDCGSSGPYLFQEARSLGLVASERIAHGAENMVSLLQSGSLLLGLPWLEAWMTPDTNGFIDGDGSLTTLEDQIRGGIAGGHEVTISACEKLKLTVLGTVDAHRTVLRLRNHWTASWGIAGSCYIHLSTLVAFGASIDVRQFIAG
jgi:hypothetical protein